MSTRHERLAAEHERLLRLAQQSNGSVRIASAGPDLRQYVLLLRVKAPVGSADHYSVVEEHRLSIALPDDFPTAKPLLRFERAIFAPNMWANGGVCIVEQDWFPARNLAEVVCDVIDSMQWVDPNLSSAANGEAAHLCLDRTALATLRARIGAPVRLAPPAPQVQPSRVTPATPAASGIRSVHPGAAGTVRAAPGYAAGAIRTVQRHSS